MEELILKYLEIGERLEEEYGIIGVSDALEAKRVQVYRLENLMKIADGENVRRQEFDCTLDEYYFVKNGITYLTLVDKEGVN